MKDVSVHLHLSTLSPVVVWPLQDRLRNTMLTESSISVDICKQPRATASRDVRKPVISGFWEGITYTIVCSRSSANTPIDGRN